MLNRCPGGLENHPTLTLVFSIVMVAGLFTILAACEGRAYTPPPRPTPTWTGFLAEELNLLLTPVTPKNPPAGDSSETAPLPTLHFATATQPPSETPLPKPSPQPTQTPKPAVTIPPENSFLPVHEISQFQPPNLPTNSIWIYQENWITDLFVETALFPLALAYSDGYPVSSASIVVSPDGSKLAYTIYTYGAGHSLYIDDLVRGERHKYTFPSEAWPPVYITGNFFGPDQQTLLVFTYFSKVWAWFTIDLQSWTPEFRPINLENLQDSDLLPHPDQTEWEPPGHASRYALLPIDWAEAGVYAQKILPESDAPRQNLYRVNLQSGDIRLVSDHDRWHLPSPEFGKNVFAEMSVSFYDNPPAPGDPFTTDVWLMEDLTSQPIKLFTIEDFSVRPQIWSPDQTSIVYTVHAADSYTTEVIGIYTLNDQEHQPFLTTDHPLLDTYWIQVLPYNEHNFLLVSYMEKHDQTNLFTMPFEHFELDSLTHIRTIPGRISILFTPRHNTR